MNSPYRNKVRDVKAGPGFVEIGARVWREPGFLKSEPATLLHLARKLCYQVPEEDEVCIRRHLQQRFMNVQSVLPGFLLYHNTKRGAPKTS